MPDSRRLAPALQLSAQAAEMVEAGQPDQAAPLVAQAWAAALRADSAGPVEFRLVPRERLPHLGNEEHVVAQVTGGGRVVVRALRDMVTRYNTPVDRLPIIGRLCAAAAARMAAGETGWAVIDLGDGHDAGAYPRVSFSSSRADAVLIPDPYFYESDGYAGLRQTVADTARPWERRLDQVFWRGSTTGMRTRTPPPGQPDPAWDWLPRLHLCALARTQPLAGRLDVAVTALPQIEEPHLRERIEAAGLMAPPVPPARFIDYRYQIDMDGNTNSWSLLEKMIMGATIFKVRSPTGYRQWFYDRLEPWDSFIPVASDLSDLAERVDWAFAHPGESRRIAQRAAAIADDLRAETELAAAEAAFLAALHRVRRPD